MSKPWTWPWPMQSRQEEIIDLVEDATGQDRDRIRLLVVQQAESSLAMHDLMARGEAITLALGDFASLCYFTRKAALDPHPEDAAWQTPDDERRLRGKP